MIPSELSSNYPCLDLISSCIKVNSTYFVTQIWKVGHTFLTAELSIQSTYLFPISSMPSTAYTTRIRLNPVKNFSFASVMMQSLGNRECWRDSIKILLDFCLILASTVQRQDTGVADIQRHQFLNFNPRLMAQLV